MVRKKRVVGVIPARYASTRFPGKVLALLKGKPMIQHVYEGAKKSRLLDELVVACDDKRILDAVRAFGGQAVMTSSSHASGTDRVSEAVSKLDCEWVVNIQADEPLMRAVMVDQLVRGLQSGAQMSTLARSMKTLEGFLDPNVVKVVCDGEGFALYFSRAPIPHLRKSGPEGDGTGFIWLKHIGIYGYQKDFLRKIAGSKGTRLEFIEKLEQLRVLETGGRIKVMLVEQDCIGVDTPKDLEEVRKLL